MLVLFCCWKCPVVLVCGSRRGRVVKKQEKQQLHNITIDVVGEVDETYSLELDAEVGGGGGRCHCCEVRNCAVLEEGTIIKM